MYAVCNDSVHHLVYQGCSVLRGQKDLFVEYLAGLWNNFPVHAPASFNCLSG